ncbi:MAG: hypothetical protein GWN62_14370, partial [Aliifodinibius sp.]|nr:hypothetical protein [Fodinibius sp.]
MRKAFTAFLLLIGLLGLGGGVLTVSAIAQDGPINVQVTDNTRTDAIQITWDDNPDAGSGVNNGVVILYRRKGATSFAKLANVLHGWNEYLWYDAPPGLEYEFRIGYCGASEDFYLCDEPWIYLWNPDTFPGTRQLTKPTYFSASDGVVGSGISLNWDNHPQQGENNFYYKIMIATTSNGTYVLGPGVFISEYLDTTMDPLERRYYKVYACIERCSEYAYDAGQRGLDKPENLIIDHDIDGVYLDWDWVQSADFYAVYRSPMDTVSYTKLGEPS